MSEPGSSTYLLPKEKKREPMHPLLAKTMAAATGATMTGLTMTPFDVIKTRLQTQPPISLGSSSASTPASCCQPSSATPCVRNYSSMALHRLDFRANPTNVICLWDERGVPRSERVRGFWDAGLKVWRAEGVRGLWKGVGTTLVIAVPSQTIYMVMYDTLRRNLPSPASSPLSPMIAGILARSLVSSLSSPIELFRTRLQSTPMDGRPHTFRSVTTGIRAMVRTDGVRSLYRGLGPTLWRDVPFSGVYWAGYELIKTRLRTVDRRFEGPTGSFLGGALSGTISAFLTSPFDVLKTRRQALAMTKSASGTFPLLAQIVRQEGASALYAGLTPRIAKIAPACGIMIACYEGVGKYFDVEMSI